MRHGLLAAIAALVALCALSSPAAAQARRDVDDGAEAPAHREASALLRSLLSKNERLEAVLGDFTRRLEQLEDLLGDSDSAGAYRRGFADGARSRQPEIDNLEAEVRRLTRILRGTDDGGDRGDDDDDDGGGDRGDDDDDDPPRDRGTWVSPLERLDPVRPTSIDAEIRSGSWRFPGGEFVAAEYPARAAYEAVEQRAGHEGLVTIGVSGAGGRVSLGGSGWGRSDASIVQDDEPIEVAYVGLDDGAELGPIFLGGDDYEVAYVAFHGLGIRGHSDSFAIRQNGPAGEIVFDEFWILEHHEVERYTSGLHLHGDWERLTLKGYQPRGLAFREHVFYLKPGGVIQVLDCNLWGGNYTGLQARSHGESTDGRYAASPAPHGEILIEGNYCDGWGWNHDGGGGGAWLSVWCSLEYTVAVRGNVLTDGRYAGLGILQGVPYTSPYLTEDGYSHADVWVEGNSFETRRSSRAAGTFTAARELHFAGENVFDGGAHDLVFQDAFTQDHTTALPVGSIVVHGTEAIPAGESKTWTGSGYAPFPLDGYVLEATGGTQ